MPTGVNAASKDYSEAKNGSGKFFEVNTSKKLSKALKSGKYTTIMITTGKNSKYTIPKGKFGSITLVVTAGGAQIKMKKGAVLGT